jgi:RimJ/RimL family protein N-acetyltransferase
MLVIQTERLNLRWLENADADFILDLLNQPSWLEYIGDRGVRNLDDARDYINNGPLAMIAQHGFGLYLVELGSSGKAIGLCGLLKRESLDDPDIGFAFLPEYCGQGYAGEAAQACVAYARDEIGLKRLVAITLPNNRNSIRLLTSLGMDYEKDVILPHGDELLQLFSRQFS